MKNKFPYSGHLIIINNFCDKYHVNKMDQALLWTTVPIIRVNFFLKSLATRKDFIGKISKKTFEPFQRIIQIFNFNLGRRWDNFSLPSSWPKWTNWSYCKFFRI